MMPLEDDETLPSPDDVGEQGSLDDGPAPDEQETDELLTPRASQDPSQPFASKPAEQAQPQGQPPSQPVQAPMTAPQAPEPQSRGFDWSRAFWAAGGGQLGAFDAERNRMRDAPAKAQREELARQLGQQQVNAFSLQRQKARDAIDPGSKDSLAAQEEFKSIMIGRAKQLAGKHPTLAAEFQAYADKAPSMHAVAIDKALKNPRMSEVLRQIDSESRNDLASANLGVKREALGATVADRNADNQRAAAEFGLKRSELDLRHKERADALAAQVAARDDKKAEKIPSDGEVAKHLDRQEALSKINEAKALLASGKIRYLGKGAKLANSVLSQAPDALDVRTPEERKFASLVQWIAAPERHELFGGSLTPGESGISDELLASIGRNKESVLQSLNNMEQGAQRKNLQQKTLYPGLSKIGNSNDSPSSSPVDTIPDGTRGKNKKTGQSLVRKGGKWVPE